MAPLFDKTVFIFQSGGIWEEYQGAGFALPWHYYYKCGFTLEQSGRNLPPTDPFWSFTTELCPDQRTNGAIILEKDNIRNQLDERGWAIGKASAGASSYRRQCHHPLATVTDPPAKPALPSSRALSPLAAEMARTLDQLLRA